MPNYESFDEWRKAASRRRYSGEPLSENNIKSIWNSENMKELIGMIPRIKKETGMKVNKFIEIFSDTGKSFDYQYELIKEWGLDKSFLTFDKEYPLTLDEKPLEGVVLYDRGEELAEIKNGKIRLNPSERYGIEEIERFDEKIWELRCNLVEKGGKDKEVIDNLKETRRKMEKAKVRLRKKANEILNSIANDNFSSDTLAACAWDKNIKSIPTYDGFRCSAFPGFKHAKKDPLLSYMTNPSVQLFEVRFNGKRAIAITDAVNDTETDEKISIIDSAESASHMLARRDISDAVDSAITDYATSSGFNKLIYSIGGTNMNSAPKEFLKNMRKKHKIKTIRFNSMNNQKFYSDMLYEKQVTGYVVDL